MKLLTNEVYRKIENLLYSRNIIVNTNTLAALKKLEDFFKGTDHMYFLKNYYYDRKNYKNRYPKNSMLFKQICKELYIEEPTLYIIKKEVIYKAAMIFYEKGVI